VGRDDTAVTSAIATSENDTPLPVPPPLVVNTSPIYPSIAIPSSAQDDPQDANAVMNELAKDLVGASLDPMDETL
jgi:hypothetical protein